MGKQYPRLGISPRRSGPASLGQRCIMPRHTQSGRLRLEDGVRGLFVPAPDGSRMETTYPVH